MMSAQPITRAAQRLGRGGSSERRVRASSLAYRVGIDTGGTFTDIVALDEGSGAVWTTKTPTTPADPSVGFMNGVRKIRQLVGFEARCDCRHLARRPPSPPTPCCRSSSRAGLVVTRGFRNILEIARQSVPQGYGNSYFWVKPERIVPVHYVQEVTERKNVRGETLRPFDEAEAERVAVWFREHGITAIGDLLPARLRGRRARAADARDRPARPSRGGRLDLL